MDKYTIQMHETNRIVVEGERLRFGVEGGMVFIVDKNSSTLFAAPPSQIICITKEY